MNLSQSAHSPSSWDSQWAAATACDSWFRLVGGGGAGRPGLTERMVEKFLQRVLLVPDNHLRRRRSSFPPEERENTLSSDLHVCSWSPPPFIL